MKSTSRLDDSKTRRKDQVKKDLTIALIAILIIAAATFALARVRPDLPLTPSQPYVEKSAEVAKHAEKPGKVVMRVNGEPVTEAEFNAFAANVPEEQRAALVSNPQGRRILANEIAKLKMLEQEAQRLGISSDPDVRTQIDMTNAQIVAVRALQKLSQARIDEIVRADYEREKKDTIELRHIAVAYAGGQYPSRDGSARSVEQATEKARAIAARLRTGANFAELARSESDDPQSSANGGSLGAARREMLPPEIAGALAKLRPGQISDPVKTPLGVHVFRFDQPSLETLRPQLQQHAQQQAMQETVAQLQKQTKIDLDPTFFPQTQQQQQPQRGTLPGTH